MRKTVIILSIFALIVGSCGQATNKHKKTVKQIISLDAVKETDDVTESHLEQPLFVFLLQKTLKCKHTKLSKQFDIDITIEHYVDTVTYTHRWDSVSVKLLIKDKHTQQQLDSMLFVPSVGRFYYIDSKCSDVISYSTGFNLKNKNYNIAGEGGILVVADLNFDGKDDIALINDMGASNGPYYTFFIQNSDNKFIKDNFLTDEVMLFPYYKIDPRRKQISTAWGGAVGCDFFVYQFDSLANKWKNFRHEWTGIDGNIISQWDSITNEWKEISRTKKHINE